jgi:hypothetical protein
MITPCRANDVEGDTGGVLYIGVKGLDCNDVTIDRMVGLHGQCEEEIPGSLTCPFRNVNNMREARRGWAPCEVVNGSNGLWDMISSWLTYFYT